MCTPVIAYTAAALVGGALASKALAPKIDTSQQQATPPAAAAVPKPTPVAPPPAPVSRSPQQAARAPDLAALRAANAGGSSGYQANSASTLLTGPAGVSLDPSQIGRATLLGQ